MTSFAGIPANLHQQGSKETVCRPQCGGQFGCETELLVPQLLKMKSRILK